MIIHLSVHHPRPVVCPGLLRVVVHPGLGGNLQHIGASTFVLQEVVAQPGVGVLQLGVGDALAFGVGG